MTEYAYIAIGNPNFAMTSDFKPMYFKADKIKRSKEGEMFKVTWEDNEKGSGEYLVPESCVLVWAKGDFIKEAYEEYEKNKNEKKEGASV
jgi:hypothetical protein